MAMLRKLWRAYMDRWDSLRRVYVSRNRVEEDRRRQELTAAEDAIKEAQSELGYGCRGWGAAGPASGRLQWLEGCAAAGVPAWFQQQLRGVAAPIAAACRPGASFNTLLIAAGLGQHTACSAGFCLQAYTAALVDLLANPADGNARHIRALAAPLVAADFLSAASRAASCAADLARHLQLPATQAHIAAFGAAYGSTLRAEGRADICSAFANFAGQCLNLALQLLHCEAYGTGAGRLHPLVPRLAAALRDSQILGTMATALMTCTDHSGSGGAGGSGSSEQMEAGARAWPQARVLAHALAMLTITAHRLSQCPGPDARSAGSALGAALAHPHVASLRLSLLQTLWQQAGMEEGTCSAGEYGGTNDDPRLSLYHHNTAIATVGMWQNGRLGLLTAPDDARLPPEPGVPPGLQLARAAARTAEALCRLSRGEGLAGAYTAEQRRQRFYGESCLHTLLPPQPPWKPQSPEEYPHWVESSAWVVAAACEGLEAAAAGQQRPGEPEADVAGSAAAVSLAKALVAGLRGFTAATDLDTVPQTARQQEALAVCLCRAGLTASLDHALRLAFAAADRAAAPGASDHDRRLAEALGSVLPWAGGVLPLLNMCELAAVCDVGGVALTLAKRASLIARGLDAAEPGLPGATPASLRGPVASAPACLAEALGQCAELLGPAASGLAAWDHGAATEPPSAGGSRSSAAGDSVDEEVGAFFFQAAGRLAVRLVADRAAVELGPDERHSLSLPALTRKSSATALSACLQHVSALSAAPGSRAEARLLACQPHRLIGAACKLLIVWQVTGTPSDETEYRSNLQRDVSFTALRLAAHPSLSARVRRWLMPAGPQQAVAAGAEAASAGAEAEAAGAESERGCLEQAWSEGWRSYNRWALADGSPFSLPLTLLRLAQAGGAGWRAMEVAAESDAAFRSGATELLRWAKSVVADGSLQPLRVPEELLRDPSDTSGPEGGHAAAAALRAPLPPPLQAPPEGRALPKLCVCGFPGCGSFGGRSEGGLALKQCGGCKAVRYCGPGCQRAHWREGHKSECGALAEAAARAAGAGVSE